MESTIFWQYPGHNLKTYQSSIKKNVTSTLKTPQPETEKENDEIFSVSSTFYSCKLESSPFILMWELEICKKGLEKSLC